MATVQWRSGQALTPPILAVAGNKLTLKLIPAKGETLPVAFTTTPAIVAAVENVDNRIGPNFTTFTLHALMAGPATLSATSAGKIIAGPIMIMVSAALALPDAATDAGLLVRLFLAEAPNPVTAGNSSGDIPEAMRLMRVVVENRLAKPSGRWGSAGAMTLADVVRAPGQFAGFAAYPTIQAGVAANIAQIVAIANDASDGRHARMRAHLEQAILIASGTKPADPTSTGLYWWRTAGSGPPGTGVTLYKTILGNTFYREGT